MNRRDLLRRGVVLAAAVVPASLLPAAVEAAPEEPTPAYLLPVDPDLVFCQACRFDLFPQPRGEHQNRMHAGHYGVQFYDYHVEISVDGKKVMCDEALTGEQGVAWVWSQKHETCTCGSSEVAHHLVRGHVTARDGRSWLQ